VVELRGLAADATDGERGLVQEFAAALQEFAARRFGAAYAGFAQCLQSSPEDGPARCYLALCEHYMKQPPGPDWDGVVPATDIPV
jgi:adenylate cyclase